MTRRAGFTLLELVVAMVIAGIIGVALARLIINQSRFISSQDNLLRARSGARAAFNVLMDELRAITPGGLLAATTDSVTLRVPYAFGIACGQVSGRTVVLLMPTDSARLASAAINGYAWQDSAGTWNFVEPVTVTGGATSTCTSATPPISPFSTSTWTARAVSLDPNVVATPVAAPIYLYQNVRFAFASSSDLPGRRALWRTVLASGQRDEMVAPFDTSARFEFLVGSALTIQTTAPAALDSVLGLRLRLTSASEHAPEGRTAPSTFAFTTNVLFRNRAR